MAFQWQALIDHLRTLMVAGHLMANWAYDRPPIAQYAAPFGPPLEQECASVCARWDDTAEQIKGATPQSPPQSADTLAALQQAASTIDLSTPEVADRAIAAIWAHGWLVVSGNAAQAAVVPRMGSTP